MELQNKPCYLLNLPNDILNEIFTNKTLFNSEGTRSIANLTMTSKKLKIENKIINIIENKELGFEIYIYQILNKYKFKYQSRLCDYPILKVLNYVTKNKLESICDNIICKSERTICFCCNDLICKECSSKKCFICDQFSCNDCILYCNVCDIPNCTRCVTYKDTFDECPICDKYTCQDCFSFQCDNCGICGCETCGEEFGECFTESCENLFCNTCDKTCIECNNVFCYNCINYCNNCQENICDNCIDNHQC